MAQSFNSRQVFGYNKFNRSHRHFTALNMNYVYPVRCSRVIAGEFHERDLDVFLRTDPLQNPAFADLDLEVSHYFVSDQCIDPYYSIRAAEFTGLNKIGDTISFEMSPTSMVHSPVSYFAEGTLADYLGCFLSDGGGLPDASMTINFGPFLAYQAVCDRFFSNARLTDTNFWRKFSLELFSPSKAKVSLEDVVELFSTLSGTSEDWNNPYGPFVLRRANWLPDYFTTARPDASGTELTIPGALNTSAVSGNFPSGTDINDNVGPDLVTLQAAVGDNADVLRDLISNLTFMFNGTIDADRVNFSRTATIPQLWDAELLQKVASMLEHDGYSYFDYMKVLFGLDISQSEMENEYPIYLGGGSSPAQISAVTSTSGDTMLGTQAGQMTAYDSRNGFSRRFTKSGYIISCVVLRPQAAYLSGVDHIFRENTIADQPIPALADLSDQPIYMHELARTDDDFNTAVFGFTDRYQNYRTVPNRASSSFRSTEKAWLISRETTSGTISEDWIKANASYAPWLVTDPDRLHFYARIHVREFATLPLPVKTRPYIW